MGFRCGTKHRLKCVVPLWFVLHPLCNRLGLCISSIITAATAQAPSQPSQCVGNCWCAALGKCNCTLQSCFPKHQKVHSFLKKEKVYLQARLATCSVKELFCKLGQEQTCCDLRMACWLFNRVFLRCCSPFACMQSCWNVTLSSYSAPPRDLGDTHNFTQEKILCQCSR